MHESKKMLEDQIKRSSKFIVEQHKVIKSLEDERDGLKLDLAECEDQYAELAYEKKKNTPFLKKIKHKIYWLKDKLLH